jgi:hypothetical protein
MVVLSIWVVECRWVGCHYYAIFKEAGGAAFTAGMKKGATG